MKFYEMYDIYPEAIGKALHYYIYVYNFLIKCKLCIRYVICIYLI